MNRFAGYKTHIPVNARPGVPSRIAVKRVIDLYCNEVVASVVYKLTKVVLKGDIAVRP